jgi:phage shock protein C
MAKKLYRSLKDRKIAGVCGGIGEYFDTDPTLIRLLAVALVLAGGSGILGYILAWIIVPEAPAE